MGFLAGRGRTVAAFCVLILLWGSSFAVVEVGLRDSPPLVFAGMRALIGGAVMVGIAFFREGWPDLRRDWRPLLILAVFNVGVFLGLQTYAVLELPSGLAAVLIYLQPILTGFLAWAALGEMLSVGKVFGLLIGFAGIAVVSASGIAGGITGASVVGVICGVASALSWSVGTVYYKSVQHRVSPFWSAAAPFVVGGLALLITGALTEPVASISWNPRFVAALLCAALAGSAAAWVLWFSLVQSGEASRVAVYIFAVPLTAVVIGVVVLGEELRVSLAVGIVLVAIGIYLVNRSPVSKPRPEVERIGDGE